MGDKKRKQCRSIDTIQRRPYIQRAHKYNKYYKASESDEKLYVDLRRGRGYTSELEKVVRNDSSLTLTITLRNAATKKVEGCWLLPRRIFILYDKFRFITVIQRLWHSYTKRNGCISSLNYEKT